jgi:lipopolysaccharide transport system permease protein
MLVPLIIQTLFLIGVTFFLSALAVFLRDTVHLVGIIVQFWFFLTPVFYSLDIIGERLARVVRWLNPMASLVDFYRDILYGQRVAIGLIPTPGLPALDSVLRVFVTALVVLALGYWFFQRQSGRFGEEI